MRVSQSTLHTTILYSIVCLLAGVVTDTVQQTTDRLQDVGQRTWTTARDTGKVLVTKPLHPLMSLFGKPPKR